MDSVKNNHEALLSVENLSKRFGRRDVVSGVDFQVQPGEVFGLLGPNGAGKTTTFRMTMGMLKPDQGRVLLAEKDITDLAMYQRARRGLGYLAQTPSVFHGLSVLDNLKVVLESMELNQSEQTQKLDQALNTLKLSEHRHKKAKNLSGGLRRRLEITRVLLREPRLILLDEPFSGVDPLAVHDIQKIIKRLSQDGLAILITDHNVKETLSITDRASILVDGRVVVSGTPQEIVSNSKARQLYLGDSIDAYLPTES